MEPLSLTIEILISLGAGAAILFCLLLIARFGPETIALFLGLGFLMVHNAIGTMIDKITGRNGFSGGLLILVPQIHKGGMMTAFVAGWLFFSAAAFAILRLITSGIGGRGFLF